MQRLCELYLIYSLLSEYGMSSFEKFQGSLDVNFLHNDAYGSNVNSLVKLSKSILGKTSNGLIVYAKPVSSVFSFLISI